MIAMILAAGVGSRLRPLTDTCPKPMLPVAGKPLLERTLEWLYRYGVREARLNTHHLPQVVSEGLGDGSRFGMRLHYSYEPELLGTAGAVRKLAHELHEPFVVIYGDMLLDFDLHELQTFHTQRGALMTLGLKRTDTPQSQGMIELGATGRVLRFVEKPAVWDGGDTANAGIYLCEPQVIEAIPEGFSDFGHQIIPALLSAGAAVYGHMLGGYLLDIGTPAAYAQAQRDWAGR